MFKKLKNLFSKQEPVRTIAPIPTPLNTMNLFIPPIVQQFTTEDEPKLADYPKEKYSAFWEIILAEKENYFSACVRFYDYTHGLLDAEVFNEGTIPKLKAKVNDHILVQMKKYERK